MSQPTFDKNDRIKSLANLYDEGTIDEHGLLFSQRWQAQGNGAFCHGKVTRVLKKKSRETQKYKIRWDDKSTSVAEHQHLVTECGVDDSDEAPDEEDRTDDAHITIENDDYATEDEGGVFETDGGEYHEIRMDATVDVEYEGTGNPPPLPPPHYLTLYVSLTLSFCHHSVQVEACQKHWT